MTINASHKVYRSLTLIYPDRAEEAVNEVKRQAMDEVQKAVAEAEQKAFEMIAAERAKMEKTLAEAKRKAQEDAIMIINEQEDSSEVSRDTQHRRDTEQNLERFWLEIHQNLQP